MIDGRPKCAYWGLDYFTIFIVQNVGGRFKASSMNYTVGISDIGYLTKIGEPYCSLLQWNIKAYVPKVDIGKYSKFWIEKKSDSK